MPYTEIPTQCRGTIRFGRDPQPWFYFVDSRGELSIRKGEDTRDWTALDRGALDYSKIAMQEHATDPFEGHDGPRTKAACIICAAAPTVSIPGHSDLIVAATQRLMEQKKAGQLGDADMGATVDPVLPPSTIGPAPTVMTGEQQAAFDARQTEARRAQAAAQAEYEAKKQFEKPKVDPTVTAMQNEMTELKRLLSEVVLAKELATEPAPPAEAPIPDAPRASAKKTAPPKPNAD